MLAVVALFFAGMLLLPAMVLLHEIGHARAAEQVTTGRVMILLRRATWTLPRWSVPLLGLTRTEVRVSLLWPLGGLTVQDGPENQEDWRKILAAGCRATLLGAAAGAALTVVSLALDLPRFVTAVAVLWAALCLADQSNRCPRPRPSSKNYGSDGWHLRRMKTVNGYLPPAPLPP